MTTTRRPRLDFDSDISKKLTVGFEKDNLCRDWTPRKTERISLVHNELDGCVPYANATKMADYLEQKGFNVYREIIENKDRYVDGTVFLNKITIEDGELSPTLGAHEACALQFAIEFLTCHLCFVPLI